MRYRKPGLCRAFSFQRERAELPGVKAKCHLVLCLAYRLG